MKNCDACDSNLGFWQESRDESVFHHAASIQMWTFPLKNHSQGHKMMFENLCPTA